jgi:glucose/arabinose dehydrogenase
VDFRVVQVADGLEHPWSLAFLPDGGVLITERPGRLKLLRSGSTTTITGLPVVEASGQGGLLDVALHPRYGENGLIYLSYATRIGSGRGTAIARGRLAGSQLLDVQEIFRMRSGGTTTRHFGSRMVFAADGTLLFTIGDRGQMARAQDPRDHAGKTLRIADDGSIPADNPFVGRNDALPEIYTYGNRNAQGMAVHPDTGRIWQHEHGPRGGDEVNVLQAGANYGWPEITYGIDYSGAKVGSGTTKEGMEQPLVYWVPSIAPSGMTFYNGAEFPEWQGNLFVGALAGQHLRRLVLSGDEVIAQEVLLQRSLGRIRDVRQGPDGRLWLLTDERNGKIYRLERVK